MSSSEWLGTSERPSPEKKKTEKLLSVDFMFVTSTHLFPFLLDWHNIKLWIIYAQQCRIIIFRGLRADCGAHGRDTSTYLYAKREAIASFAARIIRHWCKVMFCAFSTERKRSLNLSYLSTFGRWMCCYTNHITTATNWASSGFIDHGQLTGINRICWSDNGGRGIAGGSGINSIISGCDFVVRRRRAICCHEIGERWRRRPNKYRRQRRHCLCTSHYTW